MKNSENWTKRELCIYKNGVAALANSVILQWQLDGRPEKDRQAMEYWYGVLEHAIECHEM